MMHGRPEKSDPAIVADEADEQGRATGGGVGGAKGGDRGECGTSEARAGRRTGKACPRRWTAYGQAARHRKKERFTALFHHLSLDLLREAFLALKRDAAPGVDGLTWRTTRQTLTEASRSCTTGSTGERTGPCRPGDGTSRSRMAGSGRWRSRPWRTRSSRGPRSRC